MTKKKISQSTELDEISSKKQFWGVLIFYEEMYQSQNFFQKKYTKITEKLPTSTSPILKNLGVFGAQFLRSGIFSLRLADGKRVP